MRDLGGGGGDVGGGDTGLGGGDVVSRGWSW